MTISVAILFTTGCGRKASPEYQRTSWYESGESAPNLYPGRNFCTADIDRHPEIGFVLHSVNEEGEWTRDIETKAVISAIQLCRIQFSRAFRNGEIKTWDGLYSHRSQWLPPHSHPTPTPDIIPLRTCCNLHWFVVPRKHNPSDDQHVRTLQPTQNSRMNRILQRKQIPDCLIASPDIRNRFGQTYSVILVTVFEGSFS